MRIRTVKPEFWTHEGLSSLPDFTRLLAIALLNLADDEGYFIASPYVIRGAVFPFLDDSSKIHGALVELSSIGYIQLGKSDDGRDVGRVVTFASHQKIDRPTRSKIKPSSTFVERSTNNHRALAVGKERKGKERNIAPPHGDAESDLLLESENSTQPPSQQEFQETKKEKAAPGPPRRDELFETLARVTGSDPFRLTKPERGRINVALKDIRAACPDLAPSILRRAASAYRELYPDPTVACTPTALSANWSKLHRPAKKEAGAPPDHSQIIDPPEDWRDRWAARWPDSICPPDWHSLPAATKQDLINPPPVAA